MNFAFELCIVLGGIAFFFWVYYLLGVETGKKEMVREAVNAGKAEYYLDKNNKKQWRWK